MLVISRKKSEVIMISDDISITVIDIGGNRVRLGINCPGKYSVHRAEVYNAIVREEATEEGNSQQ